MELEGSWFVYESIVHSDYEPKIMELKTFSFGAYNVGRLWGTECPIFKLPELD